MSIMLRREIIPVSEVPSLANFDPELDRFSWDFSLPPTIDKERIGVDVAALARIHRVGSIRASHVLEYHGGEDEYDVRISGINSNGTALAGAAGVLHPAESSSTRLVDDTDGTPYAKWMKDYFQTTTVHKLNKDKLASNVAESRKSQDVSREEAWAKVLNVAIRGSLAEGARKHLVEREKKRTRVVDAVALGANALFVPYELANNHLLYPEIVLTSYLAMQAILLGGNSWANKQIFDDMLLADLRWSLTGGGWQPEKYFATKALLHVTPIIRYRK